MNTDRITFLEKLFKEISGLNYAFLNYFFDGTEKIPSDMPVEILIDKEDYTALLYVISSSGRIKFLRTRYGQRSQVIEIRFGDLSSVFLKIKVALTKGGNVLMNADEVLKSAISLESSVRIPSPAHQFEYALLNSILNQNNVPEFQQHYFTKMNFQERSEIFGHVASKYKFVIHLLDDLYLFHNRNYRKIKLAVKMDNRNKGMKYVAHKAQFAFQFLYAFFFARWQEINMNAETTIGQVTFSDSLKTALQRNAVVKISH